MPIPPFNSDGLLPPGRYSCTASEVEQYFVVGYPTSQTRRGLFDGWAQYRTTLGALVPLTAEWIGGGFVENKENPSDLDVCALLEGSAVDALAPASRQALGLLMGQHARSLYGCDAHPLIIYPEGHPNHSDYLRVRGYWDDWWGQTRGKQSKGYLEVK
jgi:hypothetical protein